MSGYTNLALKFKHGSASFRRTHHHACKFFSHMQPALSPNHRLGAFLSCHQYRPSCYIYSHRAQNSGLPDLNIGEPPIDDRHTATGVTIGGKGIQRSSNRSLGEAGQTVASHLGKETDTREFLRALARETEERLTHAGRINGHANKEDGLEGRMIGGEEGKSVWALGVRVIVKCPGEMTGGSCCLMEYSLSPGDGCKEHIHQREDETWYLLEGEMEWKLEDRTYHAKKGCFIHLPKHVPHSFHNNSTEPARMLVTCLPAGFENYFLDIGVAVDPDPQAKKPATTAEEASAAIQRGRKYGITFVPSHSTHI